jgi:hypothetical protein
LPRTNLLIEVACEVAAEHFMPIKYRPPAVIIRPPAKSMHQLDFREALSTPEEKLSSLPAFGGTGGLGSVGSGLGGLGGLGGHH